MSVRADPLRGIEFAADSHLLGRALSALEDAPQRTEALARRVFGLTRAPGGLAARLVYDLLGADERVRVDRRGVWRLAPPPRGAAATPLAEIAFAVVDLETTGSSPAAGGRVMEIACVEVRGGRLTDEFSTLVNPGRPISPWVSRLTGITPELVADAPRFAEIGDLVAERLRGRVFAAHNAAFDWRFLSEEMRRARAVLPRGPRLCTVRLARRAVPGLRHRGLDAVARYYGVEIVRRHRAYGDALATASVLVRMLEAADRSGIRTWGELEAWVRSARKGRKGRKGKRAPRAPAPGGGGA